MPTPEQCAWAAGFMDGEGSIYIREPHGRKGHRSSYAIVVNISQDDIRPMLFIQNLWGGSVNPGPVRDNGKCSTRWTVTALSAARFLEDILPFLLVKREQASLALELQSMKRPVGWGHPIENTIYRRWGEIRKEIQTLNAKYPGFYDYQGVT